MSGVGINLDSLESDLFSQTEALLLLRAASSALALELGYQSITPDKKAQARWSKIVAEIRSEVFRAYPGNEAHYLWHKAKKAAQDGINTYKQAMQEMKKEGPK